jgi:hypothetical protein
MWWIKWHLTTLIPDFFHFPIILMDSSILHIIYHLLLRCAENMASTQHTHVLLASLMSEHFPHHRVWKSSFKYNLEVMVVETKSCNDTGFDNLTHITFIVTVTINACLHAHTAH